MKEMPDWVTHSFGLKDTQKSALTHPSHTYVMLEQKKE